MAFNEDGKRQASPRYEHTGIQEPVFPRELERKIFELAALTYRPCIVQLIRVAHRVRLWSVLFLCLIPYIDVTVFWKD